MKKIIFIFLFLFLNLYADVEFLNSNNFKKKTQSGIVVVEFWADWNKQNQFNELTNLKDCRVYRACISSCNEIAKSQNIKAVPTIIVYSNGNEIKRYTPNIMLQLETDKTQIQKQVDKLIIDIFN